jgi:hypothetical protein
MALSAERVEEQIQVKRYVEISRDRTMLIWDPSRCAINDEVRIADYLRPFEMMKKT